MFVQEAVVPYDPQSCRETDVVRDPSRRDGLALVMPMAGRGSRFSRQGVETPKPLIELSGRPFFWWAAESVRRIAPPGEMVFVVLAEHVRRFAIDEVVRLHYPDARIVALADVTSGAAETAAIGLRALEGGGPVAVCDSDHAFACGEGDPVEGLGRGTDAALLCFASTDAAYSYAELDSAGAVVGTAEKRVVSPFAIAGCYLFSSPRTFLDAYSRYRLDCPYDEQFVSGVYRELLASGGRVVKHDLRRHVSFGTPEELARLLAAPETLRLWTGQ
ncbi:MAG TPA: NTP transferase domain-containing protein [Allosphingosinicella sp.]|nr:NTP transferase domain-containing protein [Allosphingosinicella sp.]